MDFYGRADNLAAQFICTLEFRMHGCLKDEAISQNITKTSLSLLPSVRYDEGFHKKEAKVDWVSGW